MSVFFLHPVYLFGLLAASLPILIHLLNRRRLKRVRFPAVRFVLLSQKRISRSYRLRHWLLLALRTLAVMLLALLLANPIFQSGAGLFAGGGPVSGQSPCGSVGSPAQGRASGLPPAPGRERDYRSSFQDNLKASHSRLASSRRSSDIRPNSSSSRLRSPRKRCSEGAAKHLVDERVQAPVPRNLSDLCHDRGVDRDRYLLTRHGADPVIDRLGVQRHTGSLAGRTGRRDELSTRAGCVRVSATSRPAPGRRPGRRPARWMGVRPGRGR